MYVAETAVQLSNYEPVTECVSAMSDKAGGNAVVKAIHKALIPIDEGDESDKNYEKASEEYKFSDPDIIAIELSYYIELFG